MINVKTFCLGAGGFATLSVALSVTGGPQAAPHFVVTVDNGLGQPVAIQDVDNPNRNAFQATCATVSTLSGLECPLTTVPSGKRLVSKEATASLTLHGSSVTPLAIETSAGGSKAARSLTHAFHGFDLNGSTDFYSASEQLRLYADPNTEVIAHTVATVIAFAVVTPSFALVRSGALKGSWVEADHQVNGTFTSLITFMRDHYGTTPNHGEAAETYVNPAVQIQRKGHGEWIQVGDHQYAITLLFLDANSIFLRARIRQRITANRDFTLYTGTFQTDILDQNGGVQETLTGTIESRRAQVQRTEFPCRLSTNPQSSARKTDYV